MMIKILVTIPNTSMQEVKRKNKEACGHLTTAPGIHVQTSIQGWSNFNFPKLPPLPFPQDSLKSVHLPRLSTVVISGWGKLSQPVALSFLYVTALQHENGPARKCCAGNCSLFKCLFIPPFLYSKKSILRSMLGLGLGKGERIMVSCVNVATSRCNLEVAEY